MHSSLDGVEFPVRSESRREVLDALSDESRTRDELAEVSDASRVTLGRALYDLDDRGGIVLAGPSPWFPSEGISMWRANDIAAKVIRAHEHG